MTLLLLILRILLISEFSVFYRSHYLYVLAVNGNIRTVQKEFRAIVPKVLACMYKRVEPVIMLCVALLYVPLLPFPQFPPLSPSLPPSLPLSPSFPPSLPPSPTSFLPLLSPFSTSSFSSQGSGYVAVCSVHARTQRHQTSLWRFGIVGCM